MNKLERKESFDTGLNYKGRPVEISLIPGTGGGVLEFTCGMRKRSIPLERVLANLLQPTTATTDGDTVDLKRLETRVAVVAVDYSAKAAFLGAVRDLRDELREEEGLPPIDWRPEHQQQAQ